MNLAAEMGKLSEPITDQKPPHWSYWRHQLWQLAQYDDASNFAEWPPVFHTMLVEHWTEPMRVESAYVEQRLDLSDWFEPTDTTEDDIADSRNIIHQAYHILRWQEATGLKIADMQSIYEFGGGYGAMAATCHWMGFKGKYYIYDFPEFALLQRWYLEQHGIGNVKWLKDYKSKYGFNLPVDLFIACYSLSETDFAERDDFLTRSPAKRYLLLYSNKFEQYDNIDYFQREHSFPPVTNWRHVKIEHLPPESWYSWGW